MRHFLRWLCLANMAVFVAGQVEIDPASQERILGYYSRIVIQEDGNFQVTETIEVNVLGEQFQRGIYRDFPTVYRGDYFTRVVVPFQVIRVLKDGVPEPFHTEDLGDEVRVYVGSADVYLEPGQYTYTIDYSTGQQLGFFDDHDELYWNATGNFWAFPIDKAEATVILPGPVASDRVHLEAYTGSYGASDSHYISRIDPTGEIRFSTTRILGPEEGLTIVVQFPKGLVRPPTREEKWQAFLGSNRLLIFGALGLFVVLAYYILAWILVGRDPDRGTMVPLFEPPLNLSPAGARYLYRMGYDNKCFTAALINLAVKGALRIEENDGSYTLVRSGNLDSLSTGEKKVYGSLFGSGRDRLQLTNTNHQKVGNAIRKLKTFLRAEYEGKQFLANRKWLVPGVILSILAVLGAAILSGGVESAAIAFMLVWLSLWSIAVYALGSQVLRAWQGVLGRRRLSVGNLFGAVFITAFSIPFFGGEVLGMWSLTQVSSIWMVPLLLILAGINYLFFQWIKRPTGGGRAIMDQIDGFRMYLAAAERDRLNFLNPPDRTPRLFEKYLPYALALNVENEWAEQFTDVLAAAARDEGGTSYHPGWYRGAAFRTDEISSFYSGLGTSLGGAVSSSSRAPGSRSGGGGGGFSGGGGGGGGGGGW